MGECEKIVGGMFGCSGFPINEQPTPHFLEGPHLSLANARSGLFVLCELLKPQKVWLPSYLCHSMVEGVKAANVSVEFYAVNACLRADQLDWVLQVEAGDLVVFVDYFGFEGDSAARSAVKEEGAWVLQDAAQALLSKHDRLGADFILYSPRKFLGVPDGGILQSRCDEDFANITLRRSPDEFIIASYHAYWARSKFDEMGHVDWFALYQQAEELSPVGSFSMSDLSRAMLRNSFDYSSISRKRRDNYEHLFESLPELSLMGGLDEYTVPLGFPIVSNLRDKIRERLYSNNMFCPLHWPLEGVTPECFECAHGLSKTMLTILCDQRYDLSDMQDMVSIIRKAL